MNCCITASYLSKKKMFVVDAKLIKCILFLMFQLLVYFTPPAQGG